MKDKIKIICLILITIAILVTSWHYWIFLDKQIQKETNYLNAYKECREVLDIGYECIGLLNGRSW